MTAGLNGHTSLVAGIVAAGSLELDRIPPLHFFPAVALVCVLEVSFMALYELWQRRLLLLSPFDAPKRAGKLWPSCITSRGGETLA